MSEINKRFYKGRVALNVLAKDIENAKEVFAAAEGYVLVGVLSKDYATVEEAVQAMEAYGREIDGAVSIGLGAGDNRQAAVVAEIVKSYAGSHINQVFPAVGATRANLGAKDSWINSMIAPTGQPYFCEYLHRPGQCGTICTRCNSRKCSHCIGSGYGRKCFKVFSDAGAEP